MIGGGEIWVIIDRRSRTKGFQATSRAPAKCHPLREGTSKGPGPPVSPVRRHPSLGDTQAPGRGSRRRPPRARPPASRASSKASAGERLRIGAGRVVAFLLLSGRKAELFGPLK